jgi:hypothetical protein
MGLLSFFPTQDPHKELVKKNVLIVKTSVKETAESLDVEEEEAKEQLSKAREILFEERKKRPLPHLDDKIVTSWNGRRLFGKARMIIDSRIYFLNHFFGLFRSNDIWLCSGRTGPRRGCVHTASDQGCRLHQEQFV